MKLLIVLAISVVLVSCCDQNCGNCSSSQQCLTCFDGYYLQNNTCTYCQGGCLTCVSSTNCTSCIGTYYNQDGLCRPCPNTCATCANSSTCTSCFVASYLRNGNCLNCGGVCSYCLNNSACLGCTFGFYLINAQCLPCDINCLVCQNGIGCQSCYQGYYIQNSTCKICPENCTSCTSFSVCTHCIEKFYLNNSACVSCSLCSKPTYCINNYFCPYLQPKNKTSSAQATSSTSTGMLVLFILAPIVGLAILFTVIYKVVSRCTQEPRAAQPGTKGTLPTETDIVTNIMASANTIINKEQSEQRKESDRPIVSRNDTL